MTQRACLRAAPGTLWGVTRPRSLLALLATLAAFAAFPSAARSQGAERSIVLEATTGLRQSPVYVDQNAEEAITREEEAELERLIDSEQAGPMYVAIVPEAIKDEAGGSSSGALTAIARELGRPGTYAIVAGDEFRAGSNVLEKGVAPRLADDAFEKYADEGVSETLGEFVELVGEARANGGEAPSDDPGGGGWGGLGLLALVGGGAALFAVRRSRRQKREREEQVGELRETAHEDLAALGQDIRALDLDVEMPGVDPQGKEDYGRAVERYDEAERALDRAKDPADFAPIAEALEEGRWAMASAKARLEGQPAPERRPPCFFDPRHGPSTREVEWAPDGYARRPVPACEADAVRIESGQEPLAREVVAGGRRVPLYDAPGFYGPYAGGFFGGFSGFLPGLLFGSMLGGAFGGWGADEVSGAGGGGDFGGGDF